MDSRTEERVSDWDSRPFDGGYDRLRELADDEFSGVVEAAGTSLFMLNGRVVGVTGGDLEDLEDATGTIAVAPHPSLPLLFAMRERGGEERAQYYTNDTPISEANDTLSSGSFTGYIELSENVLSGDYYVVYYGGRSMSCAFVGNQEQLLTDDEAFQRADDEVGIYTVWDVDIEVTDIPAPETDEATAAGAVAGGSDDDGAQAGDDGLRAGDDGVQAGDDGGQANDHGDTDAAGTHATDDEGSPGQDETSGVSSSADTTVVEDAEGGAVRDATSSDDTAGVAGDDDGAASDDDAAGRRDASTSAGNDRDHATRSDASGGARSTDSRARAGSTADSGPSVVDEAESNVDGGAMAEVPDEVMEEVENEAQSTDIAAEEEWRETTTIPSINPDRTTSSEDDPLAAGGRDTGSSAGGSNRTSGARSGSNAGSANTGRSRSTQDTSGGETPRSGQSSRGGRSRGDSGGDRSQDARSGSSGPAGASRDGSSASGERVAELESELSSVRDERDSLRSERDELASERDELAEENDALQERVDELEAEIADLESELAAMEDRLENASGVVTEDTVELTPQDALAGTNLFVRYGSKSATTMDDVHDSDVTVGDLEANLRLEYHTGFDAETAVVDGRPFDEFLYDTIEYGFVEWFVYDLVFEIRDTGNEKALGDLYGAFPNVDRIELQGEVSLRYDESGDEHREQTTFDVVVRDRMGNPLAVAAVNDGRDAATEDQMLDLQERSQRVKRTSDSLAGAFMVTSSYFEPGALEVAEEATSGSLLSRDSKESYVKLSRKQGYHLCLVETRNNEFHVNVPEL